MNSLELAEYPTYRKIESRISKRNFTVEAPNGSLTLTRGGPPREQRVFETRDWIFNGSNRGEWGGKLVAYSRQHEPLLLLERNVVALVPLQERLYVVTGQRHLGFNQGAVYMIENIKQPSRAEPVTLLPDAPVVVSLSNNDSSDSRLAIVGTKSVAILGNLNTFPNDFYLDLIAWNAIRDLSFRPTSVVWYQDHLVIGFRRPLQRLLWMSVRSVVFDLFCLFRVQ